MALPNSYLDSDSNASDPTFDPSPSASVRSGSSPKQESSTQAQQRLNQNLYGLARKPPLHESVPESTSGSRSRSNRQKLPQRQSGSPLKPTSSQPSSSQLQRGQGKQHHAGPFTSSPPPALVPLQIPRPTQQLPPPPPPPKTLIQHPSLPAPSTNLHSASSSSHPSSNPASQSPSHSPPVSKPKQLSSLRPNTYLGPPSTYRHYTQTERQILTSLNRLRAQDLSAHLYNAFVLRRRADNITDIPTRKGRARRGTSPRGAPSRSHSQEKSRRKGKGKARADSSSSPLPPSAEAVRNDTEIDTEIDDDDDDDNGKNRVLSPPQTTTLSFCPPPVWTAWPLPPTQVPREQLLPTSTSLFGPGQQGYRGPRDTRPSAELEECLIAVTAKLARQRWEAREWESDDDDGQVKKRRRESRSGSGRDRRRSRQSEEGHSSVKKESSMDVQMRDSGASTEQETHEEDEADSTSSSSSSDDIPMFTSQVFTTMSSPDSSPTSASDGEETEETKRPVFIADDDRVRQLLLPSTRHVISQLDNLLQALHKMHARSRRKTTKIGGRGADDVLALADVFFGPDVVGRTRQRCTRLFEHVP